MQFLMGLDDSYMQIRSNIFSRDPLPDAKGAYALISSKESHRAIITGLGAGPSQRAQSFMFNFIVNNRSGVQRITVSHPNETESLVIKVGNLKLTNFLTLDDVLVVHEYSVTLVSIHKVDRDSRFIIGIDEAKCFLMSYDLVDVKIIGICKQVNGLYYFDNMESNPSSNPTPSTNPNPKGRNRRRSKQRIEEFNLDELSPPIVTMADQRTMAQLLQAPTEGYEDAIVISAITADNFKLKHGLLTLVQNKQFFGHDKENPHAHVRYFDKITSTLKFPNVPNTYVDKPSQDLDRVNLFDEMVHEGPNTSYDDNDLNSHDQSDGSNSPNPSSPTIDLFEDNLGHPQGSNGSAKEDEMVVTSYPNTALSKDDVPNSLNTEHV
nr:ribonuclease H-like domain-containing protein [Tanacetum cinerariifolium]